MARLFLMLASFFGCTSVMLGAYASHGLSKILTPDNLAVFKTGVEYQTTHALALLAISILSHLYSNRLFCWAGGLITLGILLFSGSLYLLSYFHVKVGIITPIGGVAFIAGWVCLCIAGYKISSK